MNPRDIKLETQKKKKNGEPQRYKAGKAEEEEEIEEEW